MHLALLVGLWPAMAVRVVAPDDIGDLFLPDPEDSAQKNCTTKIITDGEICGVEEIMQLIKDAVKCGVEWCEVPPAFICPKSCWQNITLPKSCETIISCPVEIMMHISGNCSTKNIAMPSFETELLNYSITTPQTQVQRTLDANRDKLMPYMRKIVEIAHNSSVPVIQGGVDSAKDAMMQTLGHDIAKDYWWTNLFTRLLLGGPGLWKGLSATVGKRFNHIDAHMHSRAEVALPHGEKDGNRLCHKALRVRTSGGVEYLMSDWRNAFVARKYDSATNCNTAYTAHCGSGTFAKIKKCPLKEPKVTHYCMWGLWCWVRYRTIEASAAHKVATVYVGGDQELQEDSDIYVDYIAHPKDGAAKRVKPAKPFGEEMPESLDTLVQIRDDGVFDTMKEEICNELRRSAWYGLGAIQAARCRLLIRGVGYLPTMTSTISMGDMSMPVDIKVQNKVFRAEFIPDWNQTAAHFAKILVEDLQNIKLPMNASVEEINLQLSGEDERLIVEAHTVLKGIVDQETLEDLTRTLDTHIPLHP